MSFKEFLIWVLRGQHVGSGWVQNGKKSCFHTSHLITNPVFPKNKVIDSHILLTLSKLKDELTDPHKILQEFIFLLKRIGWYWKKKPAF